MKKFFLCFLILSLTVSGTLFAQVVDYIPPKLDGEHEDIDDINAELAKLFDDLAHEIREELGVMITSPEKLIGAFANSSVFASAGATQRGYAGYRALAVSAGPMLGFQLPVSPTDFIKDVDGAMDNLFTDSDVALGANVQLMNAQIGINLSRFLLNGLYVGAKVGFMNLPIEDYNFSTLSVGGMVNYQLLRRFSLPLRFIQWRGINIGTWLIYQTTTLDFDYPLETELEGGSETIEVMGHVVSVDTEANMHMKFNIRTYTIPVEVMTSIRLLWFLNLAVGAGVDIGFGSASLNVGGSMVTHFTELPEDMEQERPGTVSINMGGSAGPTAINPKIMAGVGFTLGPLFLDFPLTYYPSDNGYNFGVTVGVVF